MKSKKKFLRPIQALLLCLALSAAFTIKVKAETESARIAEMPGGQDLTVLFSFDRENVDITFISPSGSRFSRGDEGLEFADGELWSTYRVSDAEEGVWRVEYDKGANSEIRYSVLKESYGLWIQYVRLEETDRESLTVSFQTDCESGDVRYDYELWAVNGEDSSLSEKISSGWARANQEERVTASLSSLNSGHYTLRLEVSSREGDAELFDSMTGEEFDFTNRDLPSAMQGGRVYLDMGNHTCRLDWKDAVDYGDKSYKVIVSGSAGEIYRGELDSSVTDTTVVYPVDETVLQISLSRKKKSLWSEPFVWEIDLQKGEALRASGAEVTGEGQLAVEYAVSGERVLTLSVNGEEGEFLLNASGLLGVSLQPGQNRIYGEFEGEGGVIYVLDRLIYYDALPPEILLYDNLDGKTFYEDYVDIAGSVEGGSLTVNGEELAPGEQGEFSYRLALSPGENVVELKAADSNGNVSMQVLTLYRGNSFTEGRTGRTLREFLPLFGALLASLLVILLSFLFMRRKERGASVKKAPAGKKRTLAKWVCAAVVLGLLEAGCVWQYVHYSLFVRSVKYLELAENSISKAAEYLRIKRFLGIGALGGLVLFAVSVIIVIVLAKRKKAAKKSETEE
ncbi:MAG: hypothetical protein NC123_12905 [Butyrivibrio sp.]|nr:hypothetical protein [Acetatifactor muris]MCM1560420.1 hypothetical protein [Butyrivibrio sp.]